MIITKFFCSLLLGFLCCIVSNSCAGSSRRDRDGRYTGAGLGLVYAVPLDWIRATSDSSNKELVLAPLSLPSDSHPKISVSIFSRFDSRYPRSQSGCATSYKDGIASVTDENIEMEKMPRNVTSPEFGQIAQYRYHSDYYGDNLVSFIIADDHFISVELWAVNEVQRRKFEQIFADFVKSIKVSE